MHLGLTVLQQTLTFLHQLIFTVLINYAFVSLFVSDGTVTFYKIGVVSFLPFQCLSVLLSNLECGCCIIIRLIISIFVSVCQYYAIFFASLCTLPFCIFQVLYGAILIWFHS